MQLAATGQNIFALFASGNKHRQCCRFVKAGQIVKIAVLPERIVDVAVAGARRGAGDQGNIVLADVL
jgi:hypothetical protein